MLIKVAHMDKSSATYDRTDLVWHEHLLWKRVKEKRHLFAHYYYGHTHKILKQSEEKYPLDRSCL